MSGAGGWISLLIGCWCEVVIHHCCPACPWQDVYWNHALVKFWFANSLGDLPVYPPWALLDAVARVLEEPRQWTSKRQQMAFILPCADTWNLTPRMKDFYISRKAYSITKGCFSASAFQNLPVKRVLFCLVCLFGCLLLLQFMLADVLSSWMPIVIRYNKHLMIFNDSIQVISRFSQVGPLSCQTLANLLQKKS